MKEMKCSASIFTMINHVVLITVAVLCIIPVILVISISLTDTDTIYKYGYMLLPKHISIKAYEYVLRDVHQIFISYKVSLQVVIIGGILGLFITSMLAYSLSRADFKYKKQFSFIVFFTMLFNGGLVPWYILIVKYLHLKDTLWVLILPYLALGWYVLLMRTFLKSIPAEVIQAAEIDGSGEFNTYWRIVLPMSKPALATIGLFIILRYWNDWWLAMLFIESDKLLPLQYLLYRIMSNLEEIKRQIMQSNFFTTGMEDIPSESARMALAIIAAGPMLFIFPFFQKYFVHGLTVGSMKG